MRNTPRIGEARCIEDANLRKRLPLLTTFTHAGTYHYAVIARNFVNTDRFGLALVAGTTFLVDGLEDSKVVVINIVAVKDISDELQGRGFANTSLPKKQDGVWSLFLRCIDDPLLERFDDARKEG